MKFCTTKILIGALSVVALLSAPDASALELRGSLGAETRYFTQTPFDSRQSDYDFSLTLELESFHDFANGDSRLIFTPYARLDQNDSERSHFDIRELYWEKYWSNWELAIGVKQLFWGVTETQHLVDIINQTDQVESLDGEDKLGQPMLHLTHIADWGILEGFALPYFRERTFAGVDGRLRGGLVIDTENSLYESGAEEYHFDWAIRWSHTIGAFDFALSHFSGTSRAPNFEATLGANNQIQLRPFYSQTERSGLSLQWTGETILWKLEAISEESLESRSFSSVAGFERTFVGIFGSSYDLGALAEYHYDDRHDASPSPFENDLFVGARLALNDVQSTDALAGAIVDLDDHSIALFLESSRRIGENYKLEIEWRGFTSVPTTDQLYWISRDDYIQIALERNF